MIFEDFGEFGLVLGSHEVIDLFLTQLLEGGVRRREDRVGPAPLQVTGKAAFLQGLDERGKLTRRFSRLDNVAALHAALGLSLLILCTLGKG